LILWSGKTLVYKFSHTLFFQIFIFFCNYFLFHTWFYKVHVPEIFGNATVMSRDQNAGRIHSVRIDNSTFERVEEFKYLGTTLTNQNSIAEEIKSRLRSGNACYYSVQNLFSSRLLSKNLKIKIYRTIILPVVL